MVGIAGSDAKCAWCVDELGIEHERVDAGVRDAVTAVLLALGADDEGRALLAPLNISGLEAASDSDWDDVRALNIEAR